MAYPEKYIECIVPAQSLLLGHGWSTHVYREKEEFFLWGAHDEFNVRYPLEWKLELHCVKGRADDAVLVMGRVAARLRLDGYEQFLRVAAMPKAEIAEFWRGSLERVQDQEYNYSGELCPNPACGGLCRKGHHHKRENIRTCLLHDCRHYPV